MTKLALIKRTDGSVVEVFDAARKFIDLPDKAGRVSPPVAGWWGGGVLTYTAVEYNAKTGDPLTEEQRAARSIAVVLIDDVEHDEETGGPLTEQQLADRSIPVVVKDVAEAGPERFAIVPVINLTIPEGQIVDGDLTYTYKAKDETVLETGILIDAPPPAFYVVPKIKVVERLQAAGLLEKARLALDSGDLYTRERWNAAEWVPVDDPVVLALLAAIGADPAEILAMV